MTRKRPTGVIIVSILHIYLSLFWTLIGLFSLLIVYINDYWSQFGDSMFPPWFYPFWLVIILTFSGLLVKINCDFLKSRKWALYAISILQFFHVIFGIRITPYMFIAIINIGVSAIILIYLNQPSVKRAFGL